MAHNNILLIGGCGYIGKHLVKLLNISEPNLKTHIIDKVSCDNIVGGKTFTNDIIDSSFLAQSVNDSNPDLVYYLVSNFSIYSLDHYKNALNASIDYLNNLFQCLKPDTRFVYIGSSAQIGRLPLEKQPAKENATFNPVTYYGIIKTFEELEIRRLSDKFKINTMIGRIFNITGPGEPDRMIGGSIVSQLLQKHILEVGNLFPKRDFLDVRDAAKALMFIGLNGKPGNIYNICSGKSISIKDYLELILNELRINPMIKIAQNRINKNEIIDLVGDNSKLFNLGWEPSYLLTQTIKDLVDSYRNLLK